MARRGYPIALVVMLNLTVFMISVSDEEHDLLEYYKAVALLSALLISAVFQLLCCSVTKNT